MRDIRNKLVELVVFFFFFWLTFLWDSVPRSLSNLTILYVCCVCCCCWCCCRGSGANISRFNKCVWLPTFSNIGRQLNNLLCLYIGLAFVRELACVCPCPCFRVEAASNGDFDVFFSAHFKSDILFDGKEKQHSRQNNQQQRHIPTKRGNDVMDW